MNYTKDYVLYEAQKRLNQIKSYRLLVVLL